LPDAARDVLRAGSTGEVLELDGATLRVGLVPLFRREPDGRLRQGIRITGRGSGEYELSLASGESTLDTATISLEAQPRSCLVYAPEGERRLALHARGPGEVTSAHAISPAPLRKWTVYLVHHSHLDVGYTDLQPEVLRHQRAYLDSALDLAVATDGWTDDARFRWNIEANLPLRQWLAERPPGRVAELVERLREGRFEACALPFTLNVEACSIDELAEQLRWASSFAGEQGVEVVTAMQTDVPGHGHGLPGLLAAAGVRYLDVAHNFAARGAPHLTGGFDLPRLFRWGSAGRNVLVWHTDSPRGVAYLEGNLLGLADSVDAAVELLPEYLAALAEHGYPYGQQVEALGIPADVELPDRPYPLDVLHLRVQGAIADNAAPSKVPAEVVRAWNEEFAYPRLRLATNREFFAAAEERAADIATLDGDWTSWWADGIGSSARMLGANRRAQAKLRSAQTLHVIADAAVGPQAGWPARAGGVYERIALFDEHTWGAAFPERDADAGRSAGELQWQLKSSHALEAEGEAEALVAAAVARLTSLGDPLRLSVVNVCGFARTDLVRVFVPASVAGDSALGVRCAEEGVLPSASVRVAGPGERNRPQGQTISFLARDVPALGYRVYGLAPSRTPAPVAEADTGCVIENDSYRVEVDPAEGCVGSLVDRALGRELVNTASPFGFGQYVYDRYLDSLRPTRRADPGTGIASSTRSTPAQGRILESRSTPSLGVATARASSAVGERLTVRLEAEGAELLETTFELVHGVRRLGITQRLVKPRAPAKESVYFTFPFALRAPDVSYELVGGAASAGGPRVPGSARHANVVRHWVALKDAGAAVAWSSLEAGLVELGNIHSPYPPYGPTAPGDDPGLVVSWAMNNVWDTNFPVAQGGETRFAYAVASAEPDADARALAARTAAALTQPLIGILGAFEGGAGSFCTVDRTDVEVVGLGASAAGHDFAIRLHSHAADRVRLRVDFPELRIRRVLAGTFLERELADVTDGAGATVPLDPGEYAVLAVDLERST
jgi:hypothetical protein